MDKSCIICKEIASYKCPTCLIYYCSVTCCKKHREEKCEISKKNDETDDIDPEQNVKRRKIEVEDSKFEVLKSSEEVKNLLSNSHLRNLLKVVDEAENAEKIMEKAMQEPIFVEFADTCLNLVDDKKPDEDETT